MSKYKVLFDMKKVSLNTINLFIEADFTKDKAAELLATVSLIRDCIWDIENAEYVKDTDKIEEYMGSIRLEEIDALVNDILNQIKLVRSWNEALNKEDTIE